MTDWFMAKAQLEGNQGVNISLCFRPPSDHYFHTVRMYENSTPWTN
jgi:hypothetical protein